MIDAKKIVGTVTSCAKAIVTKYVIRTVFTRDDGRETLYRLLIYKGWLAFVNGFYELPGCGSGSEGVSR